MKDFVAKVGKAYEKSTENTDECDMMSVKVRLNEKVWWNELTNAGGPRPTASSTYSVLCLTSPSAMNLLTKSQVSLFGHTTLKLTN